MKKFISIAVFCLLPALVAAEEMQFITLLARPVGNFASVEATGNAEMGTLNFCTTTAQTATIQASTITITNLKLSTNVELKSQDEGTNYAATNFQIATLSLHGNNVSLMGGSLAANQLTFSAVSGNNSYHQMTVAGDLQIDSDVTTQVAAVTNSLTITDKASFSQANSVDGSGLARWGHVNCSTPSSETGCGASDKLLYK